MNKDNFTYNNDITIKLTKILCNRNIIVLILFIYTSIY